MVKKKAKGSCLCGSFKYEFNISTIISSHHCHCKDCQKSTGSGKATIIMVPAKELKKEGELKFFEVQGTDGSHVNRGFCPICGSPIISFVKEVSHINFIKAFIVYTLMAVFIESFYINYLFYDSIVISGNILDRSNEFRGFTANINISSFSLCLKIPLLFYLTFNTKVNTLKLLSLIMIFSSIITILLLGGRASIIALLFILIMIFIICILNTNKLKIINLSLSILIVVLSLSAYQYFNQNNTSSRVVERFSNVLNPTADQSVKERLNFYNTAFQSIRDKPLLGVGIGNWKLISIKYSKDVIDDYKVPYHVHNDFLQVAAEIGLIGGIAYMYFIFFPFLMSIKKFLIDKEKNLNKYALVFLIFGVYIIDSLLNFPMARPVSFIYLLFAMALFYISYPNNLNDEK